MLAALALAAAPGLAGPAAAIARGDRVPDGKYLFSAKLTMTGIPTAGGGERDSWCSGALIAPRWVITAGHCFRDAGGRPVSRTVARHTTATFGHGGTGREAEVVAAYQAPGTDVALAELRTEITGITPLRLGTRAPRDGDILRLTGYGLTSGDQSKPAPGLLTGRFVVDDVGDRMIDVSGHAPSRETSACPHDSGGPYFAEPPDGPPTLQAVVSTGPTCPHPGADYAARTDELGDWIASTTSGSGAWPPSPLQLFLGGAVLALAAVAVVLVRRSRRRPRLSEAPTQVFSRVPVRTR